MKKYNNEIDFTCIKTVPRSASAKQASYHQILTKRQRQPFIVIPIFLGIITAASLIIFLLMQNGGETQDQPAASPYKERLESSPVIKTYIEKSRTSGKQISTQSPFHKGTILLEDTIWNKAITGALSKLSPGRPPERAPNYELLLFLENDQTIQLKLWIDSSELIVQDLSKGTFHEIPAEYAPDIQSMLIEMEEAIP